MRKSSILVCCLFLTACSKVAEGENRENPLEIPEQEEIILENTEKPQEEPVFFLSFLPEAEEGMAYLEQLGFEPILFEDYLPFCQVPNGYMAFTGYFSEQFTWSGEIYGENNTVLDVFSDDLVFFYSESGEKYELTAEGFRPIAS